MKKILLIGAGKSATVLIDYLSQLVHEKAWHLTVADGNADLLAQKVQTDNLIQSVQLDIQDTKARQTLVATTDIVISMMPPAMHYLIALDCIEFKKHLLTASYLDETIKKHSEEIRDNGLFFLYEMGLDPGIDHMSAMQIIHHVQGEGGIISSFKSHCGGLIAPESDDNPWHYKISWNPRNIILAGKAGATYKQNNNTLYVPYEQLFNDNNFIETPDGTVYSYYPNRDSLSYMPVYNLETVTDFVRTTLRHPQFTIGWKNIIDFKLTDEEKVYQTEGMSIASFFKTHFRRHKIEDWKSGLTDTSTNTPKTNTGLQQFLFLGIEDETLINRGLCSAADVLQFIVENKLRLNATDKDLIVMMHEVVYTLNNKKYLLTSLLEIIGKDATHTAMAKTVGLPLGIATKLILEKKLTEIGLQIPTKATIYKQVLKELESYAITFKETLHTI
jgi:saccharopine dehydrogenase-like NADP-dependent oxidoreductase